MGTVFRGRSRANRATAVLSFLGVLVACGPDPAPGDLLLPHVGGGHRSVAEVEARVASIIERARVPALGCAILDDGRVVYHRNFGFRDLDTLEPVGADAVFNAASFSKPVFAFVVAQLAEEGMVELDRPLHKYLARPLPAYDGWTDLKGDERWRQVTPRMVLGHTTGLPNWRFLTDDTRLRFQSDPGDRFSYSGEGFQLLQMVIEEITGDNLEALARERVFEPLGMSDTSYVWQPSYAGRYALPHNRYGWPADPDRRLAPQAAGSMVTTAADYGRFIAAVRARDRDPDRGGVTTTDAVVRIASERMFGPRSWQEGPSGDGVEIAWGLGWGLFDGPRGRAFFHTGHDAGAQNFSLCFLESGIGVVLLSSSDSFESVAPDLVEAAIGAAELPYAWLGYGNSERYGNSENSAEETPPARPPRAAVAAETITPYAGSYRIDGRESFWIRAEDSRLLLSREGANWDEIMPESDTRFRIRGREVVLEFVVGPDGAFDEIQIESPRGVATAVRVE